LLRNAVGKAGKKGENLDPSREGKKGGGGQKIPSNRTCIRAKRMCGSPESLPKRVRGNRYRKGLREGADHEKVISQEWISSTTLAKYRCEKGDMGEKKWKKGFANKPFHKN